MGRHPKLTAIRGYINLLWDHQKNQLTASSSPHSQELSLDYFIEITKSLLLMTFSYFALWNNATLEVDSAISIEPFQSKMVS